ncbi:MAG: hypothetical protein ABI170_06450 [Microbacteriaceae bacterium]
MVFWPHEFLPQTTFSSAPTSISGSIVAKGRMLELGGNDPVVILDDALLDDDAPNRMFQGTIRTTGHTRSRCRGV